MMKLFLIVIVTHMITSICVAQPKDSSHVLHGLFSDSNPNQIYYGSFDLDTLQFNNISSLSINDVGDPNRAEFPVLPFAYDPYNALIYMAATCNESVMIASIINATNGKLISTSPLKLYQIASVEHDIFGNKFFGCLSGVEGEDTQILEYDANTDDLITLLDLSDFFLVTSVSSYCPISKQYAFMVASGSHYQYIIVNTSGNINYSSIAINFSPISMKFDYKTSTMYIMYADRPDKFISSLGILDTRTGGISKVVRTITYNSSLVVTSLSAYDMARDLYYFSYKLTESNSTGISYVDVHTSEIIWAPFPQNIVKSHGWFVKQFADKRKLG